MDRARDSVMNDGFFVRRGRNGRQAGAREGNERGKNGGDDLGAGGSALVDFPSNRRKYLASQPLRAGYMGRQATTNRISLILAGACSLAPLGSLVAQAWHPTVPASVQEHQWQRILRMTAKP